ncbi:uncharacterized protein B0T15DRAFT_547121 [Chaetomium strumarium]|uniref:Uncharacterized protein n=1 Tax=Chaetomium strumarium TaxID=1170767 RepID=A0AAJ0H2Q2_9PEZI|nr:hypothetical protein B0T15DRAFT_547121 [Chaetomium strumarium]
MNSSTHSLALVALFFIVLAVAGDAVSAALANGFEMMRELIEDGRTVVSGVQLIFITLSVASLLAPALVSFWGSLPTVASRVRKVLESSIAGTVRRASLARAAAVTGAWGYINALKATTLADIISMMFSRLVLPLLLPAARLFVPAILRKYFLWRNWAVDRAEDFADLVCVDRELQAERRRVLKAQELALAGQLGRLDQLNKEVAKAFRKAADALQQGTRSVGWSSGKYENLRPAPFAGPVAAVVPEDGPVPRLAVWNRLRNRTDLHVYWIDFAIARHEAAMAKNKDSIAALEVQLASRSKELTAIEDQISDCRLEAMLAMRKRAPRAQDRVVTRFARIGEESTRPSGDERPVSAHERIQAATRRELAERQRNPRVRTTTTTTTTTTRITGSSTPSVVTPPADVSATSILIPTATTPAEPTPSAVVPYLPPPSSPTPEEILTIAAATPLPRTAEEDAIEKAFESILAEHEHILALIRSEQAEWTAEVAAEREARRVQHEEEQHERWLKKRYYRQLVAAKAAGNQNFPSFHDWCADRMRAESQLRARAEFERRTKEELRVATATRTSEEATLAAAIAEESRLRAAWEAAREARMAQEARVESALAEETRLRGLLNESEEADNDTAALPEPSSMGRATSADVIVTEVVADQVKTVPVVVPVDEPAAHAHGANDAQPSVMGKAEAHQEEPSTTSTPRPGSARKWASQIKPLRAKIRKAKQVRFVIPKKSEAVASQQREDRGDEDEEVVALTSNDEPVIIGGDIADLASALEKLSLEEDGGPASESGKPSHQQDDVDPAIIEQGKPSNPHDVGLATVSDKPCPDNGGPAFELDKLSQESIAEPTPEVEQGQAAPDYPIAAATATAEDPETSPEGEGEEEEEVADLDLVLADAEPLAAEPSMPAPSELVIGEFIITNELLAELEDSLPEIFDADLNQPFEYTGANGAEDEPMLTEDAPAADHDGPADLSMEELKLSYHEYEEERPSAAVDVEVDMETAVDLPEPVGEQAAAQAADLNMEWENSGAGHHYQQEDEAEELRALEAHLLAALAQQEDAGMPDRSVAESAFAEEARANPTRVEEAEVQFDCFEGFDFDPVLGEFVAREPEDAGGDEGAVEGEASADAAHQSAGIQPAEPEPAPVSAGAEEAEPTGPAAAAGTSASQAPPPIFTFGQLGQLPTIPDAVRPVTQFVFGMDSPATTGRGSPTSQFGFRPSSSAPSDIRLQSSVPANPAERKVLVPRSRLRGRVATAQAAQQQQVDETPAGSAQREGEEDGGEDLEPELTEEDLAWIQAQEEEWLAEEEAKGKGKAPCTKTKAQLKEEARANARAELALIEEERRRFAEEFQRTVESRETQETLYREAEPAEPGWFDPRANQARREAEIALAMSAAAEEARRKAAQAPAFEMEDEVLWEDSDQGHCSRRSHSRGF